ncbi:MAG: response regulator [Bacteroidetes bacterium]|nr:response regulator [Bacteroidota bacterium]
MSTLLDQTSLTKEQRHYLTTIRTCCEQLLQVANSALDQPPPNPPAPSAIPTLAIQYPLHILLAEDNPINQQLAMILLKKMGYCPDIAANGKEVLDRLHDTQYDIIFMDVQMPEMDGLAATRAIRNRPTISAAAAPPTPIIIAMTANTTPRDREQCLAAGMNDYLAKPIDLPELTSMLKKWALQKKHP